jgi:hypothetical protein|nr:MAG TPA: hypothetical protein [Caudoviricetes sp.]
MKHFDNLDLNTNKIVNGGFELVTILPTSNLFQGRIVFNTSDNTYYMYNNKWVAVIDSDVLDSKLGDISTILASVVEVS